MFLWTLVGFQFSLAALLVLSAHWLPMPWSSLHWIAMLLAAPGIGLAVGAWMTMGWRKLRIHPSATERTILVTRGPYALVRHPMYTGLLWFTAALLLSGFEWWRLVSWVALLLVLRVKAAHEEQSMVSRFDEYSEYQTRVGQLFPKLRSTDIPPR